MAARVRIDQARMRAVVGRISRQAVVRGAARTRDRYVNNIRAAGLENTGRLAGSVVTREQVGSDPMHPKFAIGTPLDYAKYPEYGTRAHGPVRASHLVFQPKGSATVVFAKWVRGVRPYKYAQRTLHQIHTTDFL